MYLVYMGSVLLPIAPKKFSLKIKNQNKTMTLIDGTEINFLKDAGLSELEFEVLLPAVQYSFAKYDGGFKRPNYYTDHFEKLKTEKKPFQFIMVRQMPDGKILHDTNMSVSLESYTVTESADEGFDSVVSIKLKQFIPYSTKTVKVEGSTATVTEGRNADNSPAPTRDVTHVVETGETVWSIAKAMYGDGSLYGAIAMVNPEIMDDPTAIQEGRILKIPSKTKAEEMQREKLRAFGTENMMTAMDFIKG